MKNPGAEKGAELILGEQENQSRGANERTTRTVRRKGTL
jgi:hypothetical protein